MLLVAMALILASCAVHRHSTRGLPPQPIGRIAGSVLGADGTSGPLNGVAVTITNEAKSWEVDTNANGFFQFELTPGIYDVVFNYGQRVEKSIRVRANHVTPLFVRLEIAPRHFTRVPWCREVLGSSYVGPCFP